MADLLLEIFSEEIPARMQRGAGEDLIGRLVLGLQWAGLHVDKMSGSIFVTPRRLAVGLSNLPSVAPDINTELKGPKVGAPDAAIQGFLKKSGMKLEELQQVDGAYVAKIHQKGKPTAEVLKPLIEDILKNFPWPKSMRWGGGETTWVRPIHSILCVFDGKIVPVEFAGIKAGNVTYGHRFLAPKAITIKKADDYEAALEKAFVIADREKRKAEILKQATVAAASANCQLATDHSLLEEVTGLVEWPVLLAGKIDASYMDLPPEVLVSEMRAHQKYFALQKADGSLADTFLITANMEGADKAITLGNERVLRARLADGRFFWDQDRKKKLEDIARGLASVTYHAKLGSVADKVKRIEELALEIESSLRGAQAAKQSSLDRHAPDGARDDVKRAAALCKADLVSGMVGEFPELQGVMGRYYALHQKEKPEVADAIRDHYLPLGPSSPVPTAPVSICVALADKLDTLVSMFAIGEKPTGSKDPFALRRAALGVIRIILENNIRLPLSLMFDNAPVREIALHKAHDKLAKQTQARLHEATPGKVGKYLSVNESATADIPEGAAEHVGKSLLAFFHDRLIVQLKEQGIRHDVIKAVVADGDDDLVRIVNRAKAVQDFLSTTNGSNLLIAYKRAANIVAIEEKQDNTTYSSDKLNPNLLVEDEEKALSMMLGTSASVIQEAAKQEDFDEMMNELSSLRGVIDQFFDKVMVNVKDNQTLRAERLKLLARIRDIMDSVADFSKIEGDSKDQKKAA